MSRNLTALPFDMDEVLESFSSPGVVQVYERTGAADEQGIWRSAAGLPRTIDAVVLTMSPQELQILTEGDVSGGGIVLQTKDTLYFQTVKTQGTENRQSFVLYQGFTFRVVSTGFQAPNSNFNTYNCVRYLKND
jgi:hypothetical protein